MTDLGVEELEKLEWWRLMEGEGLATAEGMR